MSAAPTDSAIGSASGELAGLFVAAAEVGVARRASSRQMPSQSRPVHRHERCRPLQLLLEVVFLPIR